jgi:hypothetical protein
MNQIVLAIRDRIGEPYAATVGGQDCCSISSTTSTRAFLDILRAAKPDQQLIFQLDEAPLVAAGYHVTEVPTRRRARAEVHDSQEVSGDL